MRARPSHLPALAPVLLLSLAACGGSDNQVASTPTPSVTTPTTNDTLANLVASQTFQTASTTLTATVTDPNDVPSNVVTNQSNGVDGGVTLAYDATARSYRITLAQGGIADDITYAATDRDGTPAAGFTEYERDASNGDDTELTLRNAGTGGSNLSYVNYGLWERDTDQPGNADLERWAVFVYGLRTAATALPTTGTASYTGSLDGLWTSATASYRLSGTATLAANFAANTTTGTLDVAGRNRETNAVVAMDRMTGAGTISRADGGFAGALTGANGFTGTYQGAFFGPSAQEAGGTFRVGRGGDQAVGVFTGVR